MSKNYYEALNITENASREEIHNAYRELARRYHPDRNGDAGAARIMAAINEAYAVLSEPARRADYDQTRRAPMENFEDAILTAARDVLLGRGWTLGEDRASTFMLRNGSRSVSVILVPTFTAALLAQNARRAGFTAVLTLRVDDSVAKRAGGFFLIIDLLRSRVRAGHFPDAIYQELFRPLCESG